MGGEDTHSSQNWFHVNGKCGVSAGKGRDSNNRSMSPGGKEKIACLHQWKQAHWTVYRGSFGQDGAEMQSFALREFHKPGNGQPVKRMTWSPVAAFRCQGKE